MTTRNRTTAFRQCRERTKSQRMVDGFDRRSSIELNEFDRGLLEREAHHHVIDVPPAWMGIVNEISDIIEMMGQKMEQLSQVHKKHLLPGFGDRVDEEQAIEIMTRDITRLFHKVQGKVKAVGKVPVLGSEDKQIRTNVQSSMATKVQDMSMEFRKQQKNYLSRLRGLDRDGGPDPFAYEETPSSAAYSEEVDIYDPGMTQDQVMRMDSAQAEVETRVQEINTIARSINELAGIFKDMSVLVVDQGTVLDRIDYNIEQADVSTQEAVEELRKASKAQQGTRNKKCIFLVAILIMIVLIVIFLKAVIKAAASGMK
eukprot:TRINITY_DN63_c0_g1_i1.p1 TRINITY_DN63_c0_g1~~TRINITY_DN63_c0_g1_i1.p1  ORF type:complete len:314 (+),score=67.46 TRINITY_DN63_c0_g1_i1:80-1021(+)